MLENNTRRISREVVNILNQYDEVEVRSDSFNPMEVAEEQIEKRTGIFFISLIDTQNEDDIQKIAQTFNIKLHKAAKTWYIKEVGQKLEEEQDKLRIIYNKLNKEHDEVI